jgi:malonate-semialdehyde dehydrogenase (acetylating) / methylmalonate-semialdehyde dehydrogenase
MWGRKIMNQNRLCNYVNGAWQQSKSDHNLDVVDPARQEILGRVALSTEEEVIAAIEAAGRALPSWRRVPAGERIQYLFQMKALLEANLPEIGRTISLECGKTYQESIAEMRRAIENIEVACGAPTMMQGVYSEDIAPGIDEFMIRQPVGVCAIVAPFNFPGMIPFWFLPYALACGNTVIVKPSERVPLTLQKIFQLLEQIQLPAGVLNLLNGDRRVVDVLLDHPTVRAISFVGSTAVARYIYGRAAANGKRVQCQGGAKNPVIVLPDADMEATVRIVADSAFGCAGQRCLASSLAITVGEAGTLFREAMAETAANRIVGHGLDEGVEMGPVISQDSKKRIEQLIEQGIGEGARAIVDGRKARIPGYEAGNFIRPTLLEGIQPTGAIAQTEIFGPVLGLMHVQSVEEAIRLVNENNYGNMACLFTASGAAARKFRYEAEVGNIGINIGVAAPMAFFPFSGWKDSFFGDLHGQSMDAVEFFSQKKVVVERWPKEWSRKF